MTLSLADLPFSPDGALEGLWLFQLRDSLNTQMAQSVIENGRSLSPVTGVALTRIVVGLGNVVGAVRIDGDRRCLGDVSSLIPPEPALALVAVEPTKSYDHSHKSKRR